MTEPQVGDAFQVNGHFACVTHVFGNRALVRVFADPMPYTMRSELLSLLIAAFESEYGGPDLRA